MPRAKLSNISLKQLVAELERRKSRLAGLVVQRDAITEEIGELELFFQGTEITAAGLAELGSSGPVPAPAKRRGRPPGKPGRKPGRKPEQEAKAARATGRPLAAFVQEALAGVFKGLHIKEIEAKVRAAGYPTKASSLYKQIMAVVGKGFTKVSRGVYAPKKGVAATKKAAAAAPNKVGGKRGQFAQTGEQFVLGLAKGIGALTAEINAAWKKAGRKGVADVLLSRMVKGGKLTKTKEGRGSRFTPA